MAFNLTNIARLKSQEGTKEPQLVFEIDGVETIYGTTSILEYIRIGDPDLLIDGTWVIGGTRAIEGQESLLSLSNDAGTTTRITQSLDHEKGRGSSVQTMTLGLVDKDQKITQLISPDGVVEEIMGRRARVYLGFNGTSYKRDFIPVFKGIVDDISAGPGIIRISLGSPEQRKRQDIFQLVQTELTAPIDSAVTTIPVLSTANFLQGSTKPDGSPETALKRYIRIDDEIIQYTGMTPTSFTGCTRGALGTTAASHDGEAGVDSFYRLEGNGVELALKIMLGGHQDYFVEQVTPLNFVNVSPTESVANSIYFEDVDVKERWGLTVGDYVTSSGATDPSNNFTLKPILEIGETTGGTYIVIDDVSLVSEFGTTAELSFRSQWDTLPLGAALKMVPDDVDVEQHIKIRDLFFSSYDLDIYLNDTVNGKEFIETELYLPGSMFSVPRKARSSVNASSAPLPGTNTITLDETNVVNPTKLFVRRSLGKNFYNSIVYKYDQEPLDEKFLRSIVTVAADSLDRIPVGNRTLTIEAKGLRTALDAQNIVTRASNRRINRFKFAAEFVEGVEVTYGVGYNIEVGDIVILDGVELQMTDSKNQKRGLEPRLFEVINKTLDMRSGRITLNLLDTAYSVEARYGLIAPSSRIKDGISLTEFVIEWDGLYSRFGVNEGAKWSRYKRPVVKIRSLDSSIVETRRIQRVSGNTITLETALPWVPLAGYVMELANYNEATQQTKLVYAYMTDDPAFADGQGPYLMI